MPVNSVFPPYMLFSDTTGAPLQNGQIFIGQPGFEARTTPKASFFDIALTIPTGTASGSAITTRNGFPVRNGAPAAFYVDGDYSITVLDRNGVLLYTALNNTLAVNVGTAVGPVLWSNGNLASVGGGFASEIGTGFSRPSAQTLRTSVNGVLVTTQTPTGTVFAQPVSGSGFTSAVAAIAQPLNADLTQLAAPTYVRGDLIRRGASVLERLALGAENTVPTSNGTDLVYDVGPKPNESGLITLTGATTNIFTGLPSGVKRINVWARQLQGSSTGYSGLQLGTDGAFVTSGYTRVVSSRNGFDLSSFSSRFVELGANAVSTTTWDVAYTLKLINGSNTAWFCDHRGASDLGGGAGFVGSGTIVLAGEIDRLRFSMSTGNYANGFAWAEWFGY